MNPFETHGIKHLSASSLNTWAAEPALWVLQKLAGKQTPAGFAAHRGTAAETGISQSWSQRDGACRGHIVA